MTDKKTFGSYIKAKRIEKNYSQKDLAELLFVSEGAVSKWERGVTYPDITLISDICRVLEISEHEFITASTDTEARELKQEARKYRTIRGAWFWVPTIAYALALAVCLICNLAVNHTLSWFFIVLTALLCAYSFIPTYTSFFKADRLLAFAGTSYLTICLLLFTCGAYTKTLYWVPTACIGLLIGYSLLFGPMLLGKTKAKPYRFLLAFALALLLTIALLLSIHVWQPFRIVPAIELSCFGFLPALLCAALCLLRLDPLLKAGLCILLSAGIYAFTPQVTERLFGVSGSEAFYAFDFQNWQQHTNANVQFLVLLTCLVAGAAFLIAGLCRTRKTEKK